MKFNVEVDCTPEEARRFFGLPDVQPMQERAMAALEKRLIDGLSATDPQKLLEQWVPFTTKGIEQWQSAWSQLMQAAASGYNRSGKPSE